MRLALAFFSAICALCGAAAPTNGQEPPAEQRERVARILNQGVRSYNAKRYAEALARFEEAFRLDPDPRIYLNMGKALQQLGRHAQAATVFDLFLAKASGLGMPTSTIASARDALVKLIGRVGRIKVNRHPGSATLMVDGIAVTAEGSGWLFVPPGSHRLEAMAPGFAPRQIQIDLAPGEARNVTLVLVPDSAQANVPEGGEPSPSDRPVTILEPKERERTTRARAAEPSSPWYTDVVGDVLLGAGIAAAGVGATFFVLSSSKQEEADRAPNSERYRDLFADAEKQRTIGIVSLATGGVLIVGAILRYSLRGGAPAESAQARTSATPWLHAGGAGFVLERSY